jgi:hypothetical protein
MVWLAIFFFVPMYYLLDMSLRTGNLLDGFDQVYRFANYGDAIRENKEQFIRSIIYAASATALAFCISHPLAYVIAFRGGRYKNFLLVLVIAPFFTNYLIHAGLGDDPGRPRHRHQHASVARRPDGHRQAQVHLRPAAALATPLAVVTGITVQLPAVHDAAALRQPREDRQTAARGRARPVRQTARGRSW